MDSEQQIDGSMPEFRQRILILDSDIFFAVGGGQSSYQKIINANPRIQYLYLTREEPIEWRRPANTLPIKYVHFYNINIPILPTIKHQLFEIFVDSMNIAQSVCASIGANYIDIVDTPDYHFRSIFIRRALEHFGISVGKVALAMHGTIMQSLEYFWPAERSSDKVLALIRFLERLQYQTVDVRYSLSEMYAREWQSRGGISPNMIDPLIMIEPAVPVSAPTRPGAPDLAFVGRLERRKGPDLFLDLAWSLPSDSYRHLDIIGPEHKEPTGVTSTTVLMEIARERHLFPRFRGRLSQLELDTIFRDRTVVVLSSRYDSFNLVALEALRLGCPCFVTRTSGIATWILKNYPELKDHILDINCGRRASLQIANALCNYDSVRERIVELFTSRPLRPNGGPLEAIYTGEPVFSAKVRQIVADYFGMFYNFWSFAAKNDAIKAYPTARQKEVARTDTSLGKPLKLNSRVKFNSLVRLILEASLFNPEFYQKVHGRPKDRSTPQDYLRVGWLEGLNPHPLFDTNFYLMRNLDVRNAGINPLVHYLQFGARERRDPHILFDTEWYISQLPGEKPTNPLLHFLSVGSARGLSPHPLFDVRYYLRQNPDVGEVGIEPLSHYIQYGGRERRSPHPLFDPRWYLSQIPPESESPQNPLIHFIEEGASQGLSPHPLFGTKTSSGQLADEIAGGANHLTRLISIEFGVRQTLASYEAVNSSIDGADHFEQRQELLRLAADAVNASAATKIIRQDSERTSKEIEDKLRKLGARLHADRFGRVALYREMARLARKRGSDLIAATYCLRVMRLAGADKFGDLPFVVDVLQRRGFSPEAEVATAMFASGHPMERCRRILDDQASLNLKKPQRPFAKLDDRRGGLSPTVSVIVSLYNTGRKLKTLLSNISLQSLAKHGKLEVILIDSNSPSDEYRAFEAFLGECELPIVYGRSEARETIQAAWNRGIMLARAPYLCFLGVDEGLHPSALELLAEALDRNPAVDWVIADSLITNVDRNGMFLSDVMLYDRTGYDHSLTRLETCYLNYVGGLYRKSIHDRFGFYDDQFRAAGDTEFKLRVLPHITSMHFPKLLGIFNNYPEDRTTQSPTAEIEDLRAWYLHRTPAGIAYGFHDRSKKELESLFRWTLGYRKSYCKHISTDFVLSWSIAEYLKLRPDCAEFAVKAISSASKRLTLAQEIDALSFTLSPADRSRLIVDFWLRARQLELSDQSEFSLTNRPSYNFFNDNRFEQHWWAWEI